MLFRYRPTVGGTRGLANPINLVIEGIGAPAAGYVKDWTGAYDREWWVGVGLLSGTVLWIVLTDRRAAEGAGWIVRKVRPRIVVV